jgi:hypothetical protein
MLSVSIKRNARLKIMEVLPKNAPVVYKNSSLCALKKRILPLFKSSSDILYAVASSG